MSNEDGHGFPQWLQRSRDAGRSYALSESGEYAGGYGLTRRQMVQGEERA